LTCPSAHSLLGCETKSSLDSMRFCDKPCPGREALKQQATDMK
jgi:hypothetical protein